ncbi:MAG: leucine-rich repeat protein [Bacteroidales bacterium]|nr:leucine-rich repeat protein [Bacteroidales bacterium]
MRKVYYFCLFVAFSALLSLVSGCVDNLQPDPEEIVPGQDETFVLTVNASKAATTKVLDYDHDTQSILATWANNEQVSVYNKTKGVALTGTLQPKTVGSNSTTLTGILHGPVAENDQLILSYGTNNYAGQDGTLNTRSTSISSKCNYALDTVIVNHIDSYEVTTENAFFVSQQAIIRFVFYDEMGNFFRPESVTLHYGSSGVFSLTGLTLENTYSPNSTQSGELCLYIALPGFSNEKLVIEATHHQNGNKYYYEKSNTTLNNGTLYNISIYMFNELTSPLTFEAINDGTTVSFTKYGTPADRTLQYQINRGSWETYTGSVTLENAGDRIKFRGTNTSYAESMDKYYSFESSDSCYVYGNIMSLVKGSNFATADLTLDANYTFCNLFKGKTNYDGKSGTKIKSHEIKSLVLPATTLKNDCYLGMFYDCTGLSVAPELPATQMTEYCYREMFHGTSLSRVPDLPSTNLAKYCYYLMFEGCTRLTTIPQNLLPAATLAKDCYEGMFKNCTGLTAIPAGLFNNVTTLNEVCYRYMFMNCTQLTSIPAGLLPVTTLKWLCYAYMFAGCTGLTALPASLLPASVLAKDCYENMFDGCTGLTEIPTDFLGSVSTLAEGCYQYMFRNCSNLETIPNNLLPLTTLQPSCYFGMFKGCSKITAAPTLPAETLQDYCYKEMFFNCTGLATAPTLPAQTLAKQCYLDMFNNCSSLTAAPDLPATTLADNCYQRMFYSCTLLNYIKCLATNISATNCTIDWLSGVAASGTFVKASTMNDWTTGVNGIPSNWTVDNQ